MRVATIARVPLVANQSTQVCGANPRRVMLIFGGANSGSTSISTQGDMTAADTGISLKSGAGISPAMKMYKEEIGNLICDPWFVWTTAQTFMTLIDVSEVP